MHNTDIYKRLPTNSTRVHAYEHIVTQNMNNTNIMYLNVVMKNIAGTIRNNTYNFFMVKVLFVHN